MAIPVASVYANELYEAQRTQLTIPPLTERDSSMSVEIAYEAQLHNVRRRLDEGDSVVGHKIGLTSIPMQKMLGVSEPDFGHLFASMHYRTGDEIDYPLIQPRVEPEIAFLLGEDLVGPNVGIGDVLLATRYVLPAIEVIDSRISDWKIKLADTIADNASLGCFVLGDAVKPVEDIHLTTVGGVLQINGEIVETGAGGAVMGHPALAVAWLANKLSTLGTTLRRGQIVLSGAISKAVDVKAGDDVSLSFGALGRVDIRMR